MVGLASRHLEAKASLQALDLQFWLYHHPLPSLVPPVLGLFALQLVLQEVAVAT